MQLPIVAPIPLVKRHAALFCDLFENRRQFGHFENYLTGLTILPNKSMANMARCLLESADKTNVSRFMSTSQWSEEKVNDRRISYLLEQTASQRQGADKGRLLLDDTLCEHVGSLFAYVDRHYNHADDSYPLAHNLVTSHYVNGRVRFPVDWRQYRRYEEVTQWEAFVPKHFPAQTIPNDRKGRTKLHKQIDAVLLQDPEFRLLHEQFRSKITLAVALVNQAVARQLPFEVVLFDGWFLAPDLVETLTHHHKDWISLLKKNRKLETNSFVLNDAQGQPLTLPAPHIKIEQLVPLIPPTAYRKVTVEGKAYWCFSLAVALPGLGKVRIVISFDNEQLVGTYITLVSNRTDWNATQILRTYLERWPVETFYQDSKQLLGLDEYRMRSAAAIQKHWCLVFVAYSFLHLDSLPASLSEGRSLPRKTIGEASRQQAQAAIQMLILHVHDLLQQNLDVQSVFAHLFAKQTKTAFT